MFSRLLFIHVLGILLVKGESDICPLKCRSKISNILTKINSLDSQILALKNEDVTQKRQINALKSEDVTQKSQIDAQKSQIDAQKSQIVALKSEDVAQKSQILALKSEDVAQKSQIVSLESQIVAISSAGGNGGEGGSGAVYTRWGRTTCPKNNAQLYEGFAAGSHPANPGGGANYLCMPNEPQFANVKNGVQRCGGYIYGAEYEVNCDSWQNVFSYGNTDVEILMTMMYRVPYVKQQTDNAEYSFQQEQSVRRVGWRSIKVT